MNTATTTVRRRSPIAATCSTRCLTFYACGRSTIGFVWNLKPVVMAHEILVRRRQKRSAQTWRRALRDRIGEEADKFQEQLCKLQKSYAMQMPSIADRIGERFVRPMVIDRICSLVQPAVDEAQRADSHPTFRILQYENRVSSPASHRESALTSPLG